ncbi:uncharacterized protein AMSG_00947 [Thecamonas trahens ATCC 50062]|uniref:EF-hand domain-containing protein n=1 Tax=Thecamonas trahens ATCC 50062 TaxID=461836 RepID=A0A0L0DIV4_THETB|nr:hypothetical protein AMSG_00947 [Thecamonas trahens ATCC 50062]KNC52120.1 hypothetical protein AMSG_00947 [Thecamonas trahens ATCC 50062]|eukprot:XP_013762124.1 hypothetical protein AMSG_00947 [Thecamonas trahens ATCC 50062]
MAAHGHGQGEEVTMIASSDVRVRLYHALLDADPRREGVVPVEAFNAALEAVGLRYGTEECDRLMTQVKLVSDERGQFVDCYRYLEEIEGILSTPAAVHHSLRGARVTDNFSVVQEEYKERAIQHRDYIMGQKDRIYRAFCQFEAGLCSEAEFLDFLYGCGVDDTRELRKILKVKRTEGYIHFSELMKVCTLPGRHLTQTQAELPQPEPIVWETQKRSTDVISWRGAANELRTGKRLGANTVGYVPDVPNPEALAARPSRAIDTAELTAFERVSQERLYACVRDFIQGDIEAPAFRAFLHDMRIPINRDMEILIDRQSTSQGSVAFGELLKTMNMDQIYGFKAVPAVNTSSGAERVHGDIIGWTKVKHEEDFAVKTTPAKRYVDRPNSGNFLVWNVHNPGAAPPPAAPESASGVARHGPSGDHDKILEWSSWRDGIPPDQPVNTHRSGATSRLAYDSGDIFTWSSRQTENEADYWVQRRGKASPTRRPDTANPLGFETHSDKPQPPPSDWRQQLLSTRPW